MKPCSSPLTSHPVETHIEGIVLSKQLQVGQRVEKWPTTTFIGVAVAWSFALLALLMRKTKAFYLYAVRPVRTTGLLQQCIILCFYFQFLEGFGGHIHNIMTKSMSLFICIWQETKNKKGYFHNTGEAGVTKTKSLFSLQSNNGRHKKISTTL